MALSQRTKEIMIVALADKKAGQELASAVDSGGNPAAADVANFGATTNLTGVDGTGSNAADLATTESRLDAIESKINALLTSLRNAGIIA